MSQGFSENALRSYEDTLKVQIEKICVEIDRSIGSGRYLDVEKAEQPSWGAPMDMSDWCMLSYRQWK